MRPINERITSFLEKLTATYEPVESNRWEVQINTNNEEFTVSIFLPDDRWIVFTSVLMKNVQGRGLSIFYEMLFRLNYYLNGFKFGVTQDGAYVTLQTEWGQEDLDFDAFSGILNHFELIYSRWYSKIVEQADELGLRFRKPTKRNAQVDALMRKFTDISKLLLPDGTVDS